MKINLPSGLDKYQTYVKSVKSGEASGAKAAARAGAGNTDKVTISESAVARAEAGRVAPGIAAEVEGSAGPERLEELHAAVQNGTYSVAAGDVADAILDRLNLKA